MDMNRSPGMEDIWQLRGIAAAHTKRMQHIELTLEVLLAEVRALTVEVERLKEPF